MANMFERFTEVARAAIYTAQEYAKATGHNYIGSEHILMGLLKYEDCVAAKALAAQGITYEEAHKKLEDVIGKGNYHFTNAFGFTPRTKKIIETSLYEARDLRNNYVGTEHLLLAILDDVECVASKLLVAMGVDLNELKATVLANRIEQQIDNNGIFRVIMRRQSPMQQQTQMPQENTNAQQALSKYGKDITKLAADGMLDPVIGREAEIQRVVQILCRRTKNNPVLLGDPGVGKSAIIEGLAQQIVSGKVPELLKNKRIISIDAGSMVAGTKYRGEFEERFKECISMFTENPDLILFIDELHTIVGLGATEGSADASNMLKPELARGKLQLIGATTQDEYRRYIEKDSAFERRLQPVRVSEPTVEETYQILLGIRDKYEAHHKLTIPDETLKAAVDLSDRYIADRFLPDKAIDLMDEAASRVRLKVHNAPQDVKEQESKLEALMAEKEEAVNNQNYERAAMLRDKITKLCEEIEEVRKNWSEVRENTDDEVTPEDIAEVVNLWTGIPVQQLTETDNERLLKLEEFLHQRVVGQDEAISAIAKAMRRSGAGLKDPRRPIGSFLFLGPTGVGKTELAKTLAESMFGDENAMIRLDMSEYRESHSIAKLIGSPPGYVGFDDGGQLTEKVRRKPYSVILFDEIEKAHDDVFNMLLQILEDGRLTDSKGRTVDFKNTIIILTSNVGALSATQQKYLGFTENTDERTYSDMRDKMLSELKRQFKPEFLNRIDEIIVFHPLEEEQTAAIVRLMLKGVTQRMKERDIVLSFTDNAIGFLAKEGFDPIYGARPLRRAIQHMVEDSLSEAILSGKIKIGDSVVADVVDGTLSFTSK